jgi:hypothetical protein
MSRWKQGDTNPDMVIDVFDGAGRRADLTTASEVRVLVSKAGTPVWDRVITGSGSDGVVTVPLQPSDVATPGTFYVKVKVTWPDGNVQHYPPADRYLTMTVTR